MRKRIDRKGRVLVILTTGELLTCSSSYCLGWSFSLLPWAGFSDVSITSMAMCRGGLGRVSYTFLGKLSKYVNKNTD